MYIYIYVLKYLCIRKSADLTSLACQSNLAISLSRILKVFASSWLFAAVAKFVCKMALERFQGQPGKFDVSMLRVT